MTTRALLGGAAILAIASVPPTIADAQPASPQKSSASCEVVSKLSFKGTMAQRRAESTEDWPAPPTAREGAPNVLVWVIDDAGFAHLGAFGGLIDTPVLDQLASTGLRYANFHATPLCSPSRAALLTGRNSHAVHMGAHANTAMGFPGYDAHVPPSAATTARVLRDQGYGTIALGKWDHVPPQYLSPAGPFDLWPLGQGFEQFYGFTAYESDHFRPTLWSGNSRVQGPPPGQNYFLTTDLADKAVEYINGLQSAAPEKPFYMYWATGAVHSPHQATPEWIARYRGRFDMGWDQARSRILARQKKLGIIPADTQLAPRPEGIPAWSSLSADERRLYARQMEVFAAQLSETDHEFGRILESLRRTGELDNTLVIVTSDNGASAEGGLGGLYSMMRGANGEPPTFEENFARIDRWGGPGVQGHYHAGWASAGNTPFRYYKQSAFQGGTHVPLIVSWPKGIKAKGEIRRQYQHIIDISPTILEAAGETAPKCVGGVSQQPIDGISMAYTFDAAKAADRRRTQYYELWGNRGIYQDGWMAVVQHNSAPWEITKRHSFEDDKWELYDLRTDFSESRNVAASHPEKLAALQAVFESEARRNNVYPIDDYVLRGLETQKRVAGTRKHFEYFAPMPGMAEMLLPPIKGRTHRIEAEVDTSGGGDGVILAAGGEEAGISLFVKNGYLTYVQNDLGRAIYRLVADRPLTPGLHRLGFSFTRDEATQSGGLARLFIDSQQVAEQVLPRTVRFSYSGSGELFGIGEDSGTTVTSDYAAPFPFTGEIERVTVDVE